MEIKTKMKISTSFKNLKKEYDKKVVRRLNDMHDRFEKTDGVEGNPLLYTLYVRDFGTFEVTLTVLEAGNINGEFFMTKGHKHKKPRKEVYLLISGEGKLILQEKSAQVVKMKKDYFYTIPARAGHRAVNVGKTQLEFLSIYSKDSGHDYSFKFKKRILSKK